MSTCPFAFYYRRQIAAAKAKTGNTAARSCVEITSAMITTTNLCKRYDSEAGPVVALDSVNLHIPRGQFTAVMGPSGCGKSTLLNLLAGLDRPSSGEIDVNALRPGAMSEARLTEYRRRVVGVVFQFYNLLPTLTVGENIALPALLVGSPERQASARAESLAARVGLAHRLSHRPHQLSGGEMQRASIARALINNPSVLLADEPTGNLDSHAAAEVLSLLEELSEEMETTVVMVTHSREAAAIADAIVHMRDGRVEDVHVAGAAG